MAVKPIDASKITEKSSVDILNAIRTDATPYYKSAVKKADETTASVREIGNVMNTNPIIFNEMFTALVNRIGMTWIKSKLYYNPYEFTKKDCLKWVRR